jgi:hypothetical protein
MCLGNEKMKTVDAVSRTEFVPTYRTRTATGCSSEVISLTNELEVK